MIDTMTFMERDDILLLNKQAIVWGRVSYRD